MTRVEAEAEALSGRLRGEKRLKDRGTQCQAEFRGRRSDLDVTISPSWLVFRLKSSAGSSILTLQAHCVEGVLDQFGPDLIEFAAVGADVGNVRVVVAHDADVIQARVEHRQGGVERLGEVDLLDRRLIHVGVVLDGGDEVEDADR